MVKATVPTTNTSHQKAQPPLILGVLLGELS